MHFRDTHQSADLLERDRLIIERRYLRENIISDPDTRSLQELTRLIHSKSGRELSIQKKISIGVPVTLETEEYTSGRCIQHYITERSRYIQRTPVAILDTPNLKDDYYLNILDWGPTNLVAVALENSVYTYHYKSKKTECLAYTSDNTAYVSALKFAHAGSSLLIANCAGCISMLDLSRNTIKGSLSIPEDRRVAALEAGFDGASPISSKNTVFAGSHSGNVYIYDLRSPGRATQSNQNPQSRGQSQTTSGFTGVYTLRGSAAGQKEARWSSGCISKLQYHNREVCGLELSPEGNLLLSGGNDNISCVWDLRYTEKPLHVHDDHTAAIKALAWAPWQRGLFATGAGTHDRRIRFWNSSTGECIRHITTDSQVCALLWSPTTTEIISAHGYISNDLVMWHYPTLTKVAAIPAHSSRILHAAISPDGTTVATTAANASLKFWNLYPRRPHIGSRKNISSLILN